MFPKTCFFIYCVHLLLVFAVHVHGSKDRPKSCAEIQSASERPWSWADSFQNYHIYPFGPVGESVKVLCDFETNGEAWTIIQKRSTGPKEEFYRNWTEYEEGFGSVEGNFWIGLKAIYALTKDGDQELRIDLWDFQGEQAYAEYSSFSISEPSDFYRLNIGGYSGTAGDSLNYHNGLRFSTKDTDNDEWGRNCAEARRGAWWYKSCSKSNLNGLYYEKGETQDPIYSGVLWDTWKNDYRSLQQVEMKIRQGATATTGTTTTTTTTSQQTPTTTEEPTTCSSGRPRDCAEIQSAKSTGEVNSFQNCVIYPFGPQGESVNVLCDFGTDGGGWTVIQKRSSGPKDQFFRGWAEYERGFGSVDGNFWIGLKTIHALTKDGDQELRVDLWDFEGDSAYAKYSNFSISDSSDFYRLDIGGYSGTAGDSLLLEHNEMKFSTYDKDNDPMPSKDCATAYRGAWWYHSRDCHYSNLNGYYYKKGEPVSPSYTGINWVHWKSSWRSLRQVEMKIRKQIR